MFFDLATIVPNALFKFKDIQIYVSRFFVLKENLNIFDHSIFDIKSAAVHTN